MDEKEEKPVSVYNLVVNWLLKNGKEASAFLIVMVAAVIMFQESREEARESRTQQALQQAELIKELRDRELRAWETRARDRELSMKHSDSMGERIEKVADSVDELVRTLKSKKIP